MRGPYVTLKADRRCCRFAMNGGKLGAMAKTGIGVRPENRCHGTSKKTGGGCPSAKVTLTRVDGQIRRYKFCIGHLTAALGHKKMEHFFGFKPGASKNGKCGRPRKPSAQEVLRQLVEDDIQLWLQPLRDAVEADRGLVVGNGPSGHVEFIPDHDVRLKAHAMALDRLYGKPRQAVELTGDGGGPVVVEVPTDEARARAVAEMLAMTGGLAAPTVPSTNGSSNGHTNGAGHS